MDNTEKLNHLSLCAGYGGIDLGLERAGFDIGKTVYVEIEAFAGYNLVKKIEAGALGEGFLYPDLKGFPYGKFRGCFDILSGGFPCQPFSQAGKGKGDEDPRHLFPYIKDGIDASRPTLVVLENVEGIVSAKLKGDHWNDPAGTPVLLHVLRELERVGYRATAVPSSASEVGAPHQRNRWFIIGVLADSLGGEDNGERGSHQLRRNAVGWLSETPQQVYGEARPDGLNRCSQVWPSRPGQEQYSWEPPRCVGVADTTDDGHTTCTSCGGVRREESSKRRGEKQESIKQSEGVGTFKGVRQEAEESELSQTKSPLGRDLNGSAGGMGYAELCESCDNRTDELRLLGNGVVPQSCADAVLRGLRELGYA